MSDVRRVLPVIYGLSRDVAGDISLDALAARTGLSPFALHRAFSRATRETPKQYALRVRLARAAARLVTSDQTVLTLALDSGFSSHEVFTRAFRRQFGCTPVEYRRRALQSATATERQRHRSVVDSTAPCVYLYRMSTSARPSRRAPVPVLSIERRQIASQPVLFVRLSTSRQELPQKIGEGLGKSCGYAQTAGHPMAGRPFVRYTGMGPGLLTIEAGTPLAQPASGAADVEAGELPGGSVVVALHAGAYDELHETYVAMERWMTERGLTPAGAPWESYITDPADHPNPADWRTEIYWPTQA